PLPLALDPLGLPGCRLWIGPAPGSSVLLSYAGTSATLAVPIPATPALAAMVVGAQAFVFDSAAPSGIGAVSNRLIRRLFYPAARGRRARPDAELLSAHPPAVTAAVPDAARRSEAPSAPPNPHGAWPGRQWSSCSKPPHAAQGARLAASDQRSLRCYLSGTAHLCLAPRARVASALPPMNPICRASVFAVRGAAFALAATAPALLAQQWNALTPPGPAAHAMAFDVQHGQTVLFGPVLGTTFAAGTWTWDGAGWRPAPAAASP